ncbi:MAG: AAA family ATPase [Lachnospiraceae bacterium]|nr:AAA family ATPase [Lachnospiraceae bacterium]
MEILELNLQHFGKFLEHRMKLLPGVNIIYGGNETGKSTIHAFIRAMFFGIEPGRGRKGEEYLLRQPWENPAYFAGSMRISDQGTVYRIERNFYKNEQNVRLICETTGQELSAQQEDISRLLAGMSEAAFRNTVFIPQAGSETDAGLAEELQRFMLNFQETGDGDLDVSRALAQLKGKKKELERKKKQEQEILDEKISRRQLEMEYVEKESRRMEGEQTGKPAEEGLREGAEDAAGRPEQGTGKWSALHRDELEQGTGKRSALSGDETEQRGKAGNSEAGFFDRFLFWLKLLLFTGGCLGLACGVFASGLAARAGLTAVGVGLLILFGLTVRFSLRQKADGGGRIAERKRRESDSFWKRVSRKLFWFDGQEEPDMENGPEVRSRGEQESREALEEQMRMEKSRRIWSREEKERQERERQTRIETLEEELESLYRQREGLHSYDREVEAVELAMLRIQELSQRIFREAGTDFGDRASVLLEALTEGRYTHIALDEKQQVKVNTPSRLLNLRQVSYGTMNQIYFALRMAAGDLLSGGRPLPIVLDEAFAMYDDERLEAAMRWLEYSGRQVILFTCQKREKEILDRIRREIRNA